MLDRLLRPAAGGIHTVSTGAAQQLAIQQRIYGQAVRERWLEALARVPEAKVVILGVPSDVGAGFVRGANFGPQALRQALLDHDSFMYRDARIVDAGDVFVVPQLLHDDMLSDAQLAATRKALYPEGDVLPVSPLSIAEAALQEIRRLAPQAVPLVLGGDHSVAWPVAAAYGSPRMGILHFDAHTDLLETRLGVRYCFATWAYHANELIGRGKRLQQVGLRISGKNRAHWESTCDVRQYWMHELPRIDAIAEEIIATWKSAGVRGVYISNDLDGTDPSFGAATGTAEPKGLAPDQVVELIERVAAEFPVIASDLMEVAPGLSLDQPGEPARTLATSVRYLEAQARLSLR